MTTLDEACRRSTDQILRTAMTEAGNDDPARVAWRGRALHYDAFEGLDAHRSDRSLSSERAANAARGKVIAFIEDQALSEGAGSLASFAARAVAGATVQAFGTAQLLYELYTEGYEKPHREKDRQLALGASDAGVVGLVQALPLDAGFKGAVACAHEGSSRAASAIAARLSSPEHGAELAELTSRAYRGVVEAAPLASAASGEIAAAMREAASARAAAAAARAWSASGAPVTSDEARRAPPAGVVRELEARAARAAVRAATIERAALGPILVHAHADAAYGIGVQCAMHHALRVALGKESAGDFAAIVGRARADLASAPPCSVAVKG